MKTQVTRQLIKELVNDMMSKIYPGSFYEVDISEDMSNIRLSTINYGDISNDWERYENISRPKDHKGVSEAMLQIIRLTLPIDAIPFQKQKVEHYILPLLRIWYNGDVHITAFENISELPQRFRDVSHTTRASADIFNTRIIHPWRNNGEY